MGSFQVKMIGVMLLFTLGIAVGCSSKKAEAPAGLDHDQGSRFDFCRTAVSQVVRTIPQGTSQRGR